MSNFPDLKNPIHFIATLGGIGKIPIAPGTWGSIFAFFVFIYISHRHLNQCSDQQLPFKIF